MKEKRKPKFLRRKNQAYSKLGKRRKNKLVWRRPTGRDNKMREKRKGYPATVSIGYKTDKKIRGLIENKRPVYIYNEKDLEKIKENEIAIIGKIGKRKKIEIVKKAEEKKIEIYNLNAKKYLKKNQKKGNQKEETKENKK